MSKNNFYFAGFCLAIGTIALILQFNVAVDYWTTRGLSLSAAIGQHFSYYTIITNTFACICFAGVFARKKSRVRKFLLSKSFLSTITVNLLFVAIAYNVLLRHLWNPEGVEFYVNEILHSVMPVIFIFFYYLFVPPDKLKWHCIFSWLIIPLNYIVIIMMRGELTGFYPYPFLEPARLGYVCVFTNIVLLFTGYMGLSLVFISIDRNDRVIGRLRHFFFPDVYQNKS